MKRAVSISIGSSRRDKAVEIELMGETVRLERIGTNGDMEKAARLYQELDGQVDAFGVGGTDLGMLVDGRWYPLHSVQSLVRFVRKTPVVDGNGLKATLEPKIQQVLTGTLAHAFPEKTALVTTAVDRWGMAQAALESGFQCTFGDMLFSLGIPLPLHKANSVKVLAAVLMPLVSRLPFEWVYPVGESQGKRHPKYTQYFRQAAAIMGDCHYVTRYMPDDMRGKVVITNTTTPEDVDLFRRCGVRYLVTTTPVLDGRSFGTNMMEAAILAAAGRTEPVDYSHAGDYLAWMQKIVNDLKLEPQVQELNP
jgi:hypothetical protein